MSDDFKTEAFKFGTKLILKYVGADLLADGAGLLAEIGKDFLPESIKKFFADTSKDTVDFVTDKTSEYVETLFTKKERSVNFHLAKGICRVWQESLTASLPKNRAANSKFFLLPQDSFQEYSEQLEFFIKKFKAAQEPDNENLLTELFYDQKKSETQFYESFFSGIQNAQTAEDVYWETLQKTLLAWAKADGKLPEDWQPGMPADFSSELKKFLFENMRIGLKQVFTENEDFRNTFSFSVDLIVFDLIKKMPAEIKEEIENAQSENRFYFSQLNERFSKLETNLENINEIIQKALFASLNNESVSRIDKNTELILKIVKEIAEKSSDQPEIKIKFIPSTSFPQKTAFFTGRKKVLDNIKLTLQQNKTASLCGFHGLGKTCAAVEYAYLAIAEYDLIIFVLANRNDFFMSMAKCATDVGLQFSDQINDEEKAALFRHWLEKQDNFLLILDNVDKVDQVKSYLPTPNNGHILFTSNFPAIKTVGKEVEINEMESTEAELLLYRRAKEIADAKYDEIPAEDLTDIKEIVAEIGFLPLAINIIGSYIARKQKTFAQYLDLHKKYGERILAESDETDANYPKSLLTSFSLSYETITKPKNETEEEKFVAQATENSLKSCVFMLPDHMPEEILRRATGFLNESAENFWEDDFLWDDVVENLLSYSFFERDAENQTFSTHRLIPKIAHTKIGNDEKLILENLAKAFDEYMPDFEYENKPLCERYLSHLEYFLNYLRKDVSNSENITKLDNESTAFLFYKLGRYHWFMGNYELTQTLFETGCRIAEKLFGEEHFLTLNYYDHLGGVNHFRQNHDEAIKYMLKVIEIKKKIADRSEQKLNQLDFASPDYQKQRDELEIEIAKHRQSNLHTSQKLARVYTLAGKLQEGYDLITKVIDEEVKIFDGVNEEVINSYTVLAQIYQADGAYEKAEEILLMIQDYYQATLPPNHPLIFENYHSIAIVLYYQKEFSEALIPMKKAYFGLRDYYGETNERTKGAKRHLDMIQNLILGKIN